MVLDFGEQLEQRLGALAKLRLEELERVAQPLARDAQLVQLARACLAHDRLEAEHMLIAPPDGAAGEVANEHLLARRVGCLVMPVCHERLNVREQLREGGTIQALEELGARAPLPAAQSLVQHRKVCRALWLRLEVALHPRQQHVRVAHLTGRAPHAPQPVPQHTHGPLRKDRRFFQRLQRGAQPARRHTQVVDALRIDTFAHYGEAALQPAQMAPNGVHADGAQGSMAVEDAVLAKEGKAALQLAARLWLQRQLLLQALAERLQIVALALTLELDLELVHARRATAGIDNALIQYHFADHAPNILDLPLATMHVQLDQRHERSISHQAGDPVSNLVGRALIISAGGGPL